MTDPTGQPPARNFEDSSANRRSATGASQLAASGDASVIDALAIIENYRTCEFTTVFRDGSPQTWPVSSLLLRDGRLLLCTSIGFPQKAFNIRRNPKVSLLFSDPTGSGLSGSGAILIRGDAVAEDRVIADMTSSPELVDLMRIVIERQPSSKFMSSFAGWLLFPSYYWRLAIYVIPVHAFFWPTRDFAAPPERIDLKELCHVASGR